jgi:hypothetical protein
MSIVFIVANKRASQSVDDGVAGSKYFTDCTISIQHSFTNTITEYRVETGVSGSDHIQVNSDSFTVNGVFNNIPLNRYAGDTLKYTNRVAEAYKFLKKLRDDRVIFTLVSAYDVYDNCAIESLNIPKGVEDGNALFFDMTIKRIRQASVTTATILPIKVRDDKKDDAANSKSSGQQTKQEQVGSSQLKNLASFISGAKADDAELAKKLEEVEKSIPQQLGANRSE